MKEETSFFYARMTGISILIMAVLAMVAMGFFFQSAFELSGDLLAHYYWEFQSSFIIGVICWIGIWITDVLASWGFFKLYRRVNLRLAIWIGGLRIIYSLILGIAIFQLLLLLFNAGTIQPEIIHYRIHAFQKLWTIGLIAFGLHLMLLGLAQFKLRGWRKTLAFLLVLGGIGYVLTSSGELLLEDFSALKMQLESVFMLPMILGELSLAAVLAFKPKALKSTFA